MSRNATGSKSKEAQTACEEVIRSKLDKLIHKELIEESWTELKRVIEKSTRRFN